ncbi:ABC transporter ATP-binding protein [Gordoniibacillus kamchatkensis]|uniref:ABC transporter ATP-binding protein n=1 Tax=Gordoniibacillus kamchatkensis TaxID=1590651 RepID=UPI0009E33C4E|nr:ABC transporter ATP-binding protein [Paenibacillus sp. VKM B-2647]
MRDREITGTDTSRQNVTETGARPSGGLKPFLRLLARIRPSRTLLAAALGLSLVNTLASLAIPLLTKRLIDGFHLSALGSGQIAMMAGAFLLQAVAGGVSVYLLGRIGQQVVARLRELLWGKLLTLPVAYYDERQSGETVSRMMNDSGVVKGVITEHLAGFVSGIISMAGSIVVMFTLDWKLTLLLLAGLPLAAAVLVPLGRSMYKVSKGLQDETASFTGFLNGVVSEIRLLKISGAEPYAAERGSGGIRELYRYGLKESRIQALIFPVIGAVIMLLMVLVIGYGGIRVAAGTFTTGSLIAFILYLFQIVMPIQQITAFFTQLQKAMGATAEMLATLDYEEENRTTGRSAERGQKPIAIERVTYGYKPEEPVLRGVSFTIEPGQVTAIVGPSGSGKTTLFALLERFYLPTEGAIKFGDEPLETYSLESWRERIGYVSQESPILAGTIRDNLCYGVRREVSEQELRAAAKLAYADGFIEALPDGYDTQVGERGMKLSGGQRQRLAIARALLRDPQLLLLDEATSSLDSQSERVVQEALDNVMKGRTTVVIAHRLATVKHADRIVFLDKGVVTGIGTHDELYRTHRLYRQFADHQLQTKENALPAANLMAMTAKELVLE